MSPDPHAILLNPRSNHGFGLGHWERLVAAHPDLTRLPASMDGRPPEPLVVSDAALAFVLREASAGARNFVAAGGDGTVNATLNTLIEAAERLSLPPGALRLGAIGLGSSNDFHKPVRRRLGGHPARLDFASAEAHDVGECDVTLATGAARRFAFVVGSSMGVIADGARALLTPGPLSRRLEARWPDATIALFGVATVARHRNRRVSVRIDDGAAETLDLTSLSVVKNVHFGGAMRYDVPRERHDGLFGVFLVAGAGRPRLAVLLAGVSAGRFSGLPGARAVTARSVEVRAESPFPLEADGEVIDVTAVRMVVRPGAVRVCP